MTAAEVEALTKRDRNRIVLLAIAAVLLGAGYFGTRYAVSDETPAVPDETPALATGEEPLENVYTMPFEGDEILAGIQDATPQQRLSISDEALDSLLYYGMTLQPRNYEALGVRELDASLAAAIAADPAAHRVQPYRVHGWLEHVGKRRRSEKLEEHYGSLRLEDGSYAHVAFVAPPDGGGVEVGAFVRMNGVFVQMLRADVGGEMREAPLLAGRTVVPSVPQCSATEPETLRAELIREVDDDQLDDVSGIQDGPLWQLMAFARQRAEEVRWDETLELDNALLNQLVRDGEPFRGVPMRVPISGNLGCWTEDPGENCLRLDRVTKGWIGNFTWKGAAPVIQFVAPFDRPELKDRYGAARLLTAEGFFFKNLYYLQHNGDPGRAPLFVMSDVEIFTPTVDPAPQAILWGVLAGTLLIIALIVFLLRMDRRSSARLQEELTRRRRARRAKSEVAGGNEASPETS